jgi:hypothetical protein
MLKIVLTLAISLITLGSLSAQSFIGKINPYPNTSTKVLADDTVKILAVMVNFLEDRDGATFGNGKFGSIYSQNYGNDILDPLPHDRDYFESHLTFVKNYYQKVSNGKLNIQFTVLPDTFSVTKTMRNYSPAPGSDDFTPMGQFAEEVWTKTDQMYPGLNFSDYNLFVIFHAGVGRDISLPGSLGNERDLPSVYLGENSLKNIFGSNFEGFPVSNGNFKITNSMIMPETESRELETITGKFLFEITINGLLVASVASHLGLPDLFDTNTGLSAIGRFGLMDGQSIFAYNGCFPPEPSAWEKIYLGWADAVEISPGNYDLNLVTKLAATLADTVILKVPLNSSEYYLIENRQRDVFNDGSAVTYKSNGNIFTRTFFKDTTGFLSFDTDSLSGVVLDVDEFDWALPGNGIVIWHIDQNVIDEKLTENKINTDKTRRGVDVEEADGVQDIGEQFTTIFGDVVIGEGTEQDFWYADNEAELFKNIFNKDSRPDTKTNTGANSLITIKDFSSIANKMSFKVEYGDSVIKPSFSSSVNGVLTESSAITLITPSESTGNIPNFAILSATGHLFINDLAQTLYENSNFSEHKVVSTSYGSRSYVLGSSGSKINIVYNAVAYPDTDFVFQSVDLGYQITAPLVLRKTLTEQIELLVGVSSGVVNVYDLQSILDNNPVIKDIFLAGRANDDVTQISILEDEYSFITYNKFEQPEYFGQFADKHGYFLFDNEIPTQVALTKDKDNSYISVVLTLSNNIYLIKGYEVISTFHIAADTAISSFSLADLKNDGNNYIIVNNSNIQAYNFQGSLADNFPYSDPNGMRFIESPMVADIEGDLKSEIISLTEDGRIFAIDGGSGKIVSGFPISLGSGVYGSSVIFDYENKLVYSGLVPSGLLGWSVSSTTGRKDWAELFGNNLNHSSLSSASNTNTINEFFPTSRAYNYPNPVYNGQTAIRYFVGEDSKINIKIFDLAGDYVAELNDNAQGGLDNETVWNVSDIQSGVYLARIEANGSSGKTETVIIKIAVVK